MKKANETTVPARDGRRSAKSSSTDTAAASPPAPGEGVCDGAPAVKARGRPLSFDRNAALEKAMHVFWEHGYEAASISDLTAAMGITPPSLYTAFGDKARLFMEAIEFYGNGPGGFGMRALEEEPTARRAIQRLLDEAADELTQACHPLGCMMVMAATNCSVAAEHIQKALIKRRAVGVGTMQARIQRGIDDGELPRDTDAHALANFYATVYQGMSMQAKDGATAASLSATVARARRSWPVAAKSAPRPARKTAASKTTAPQATASQTPASKTKASKAAPRARARLMA